MPVSLAILRRWFAAGLIAVVLLVLGTYFYLRHRVQNALKQVPEKIGLEIKQSATGFTVSKSEQGRTLFKVEASKAVQFKEGGHAELHDVAITLYGRDSSRYDQIYGSDFDYDPQSGNVSARGEVQIDLEANPEGILSSDQAPPKELKNPIHLKTRGLVFNQKTGNASTRERVDFRLPEASGSAVGVTYVAKTNVLTLESEVTVLGTGPGQPVIHAARATISQNPDQVVLDHPELQAGKRRGESEMATLFLREDSTLKRVLATGNVLLQATGTTAMEAHADQLELQMAKEQGSLQRAILSGNVTSQVFSERPMQSSAGRVTLDFAADNQVTKIHTEQNVRIVQYQPHSGGDASSSQNLQVTASAIDFFLGKADRLDHAETSGAAEITLMPASSSNGPQTLVTAETFAAHFDSQGQMTSVHGAPAARILNRNPGQPDRISTSDVLDAAFHPGGGIESIVQQGNVAYVDGERRAWGDHARYTPADQVLLLNGSPRVVEKGMTTTARTMRLERATGDAFAEGEVKTTYSDLKPQPDGALLASASPIHVTAQSMSVHGASAVAMYSGGARLWQDANLVEAPAIDFDRDLRSMVARGTASQSVAMVLTQTEKDGSPLPVAITSTRLTYTDAERKAHFDGQVNAKGADMTLTSQQMDAYLEARGQGGVQPVTLSGGKIDKIVATGKVKVTEPGREAEGDRLVYTAAEDKFTLTGGPPSIFDAEQGKITGVSLTFFRRDDRVLVEGNNTSPAVTRTRVAR